MTFEKLAVCLKVASPKLTASKVVRRNCARASKTASRKSAKSRNRLDEMLTF